MFFLIPLFGAIASAVAAASTTAVVGTAVGATAVGLGVAKAAKTLGSAADVTVMIGDSVLDIESTDIMAGGMAASLNKKEKKEV